jgi:predicted nucleic acid-binding protein
MRKLLKIYLDTSVISHLDASDVPEKMNDTRKFWDLLKDKKPGVVISDVVFDELNRCAEPKRSLLAQYVDQIIYTHIPDTTNAIPLAEKFIDFGILKKQSLDDCRHIAIAILSGCDMIISWNFRHIVNPKTITGVKVITTAERYKDLLICTPAMLLEGDVFNA